MILGLGLWAHTAYHANVARCMWDRQAVPFRESVRFMHDRLFQSHKLATEECSMKAEHHTNFNHAQFMARLTATVILSTQGLQDPGTSM